jgi:RHS repeat-associated protein
MTDGLDTTLYAYNPINASPAPGAGQLASIDGPNSNDTITYGYDELGRRVSTSINGVATVLTYDAAGRVMNETNALGSFTYAYEGVSSRLQTTSFPNGQMTTNSYGDNLHDRRLQQITHRIGPTPISVFSYERDIPADRITAWSQQAGAAAPDLYTFGYDAADRLLSATVTNAGSLIDAFIYAYDADDNRLMEVASGVTNAANYNALNQISTTSAPGASRTNRWDTEGRLVGIDSGNTRTEFSYDALRRLTSIRQLTNNVESSFRRLLWRDGQISEERDASNMVTKRFFIQGMQIVSGTNAGVYFYTKDHLGSIREVIDSSGNVRARYAYDPYGRQTLISGDIESDFGFAGMFWSREAQLSLTLFRAYDSGLGRWLSRDPLRNAEIKEGANLYAYVGNNPINAVDPLGLCCEKEIRDLNNILTPGLPSPEVAPECHFLKTMQYNACTDFAPIGQLGSRQLGGECVNATIQVRTRCEEPLRRRLLDCLMKPCQPSPCAKVGAGSGNLGGGFPDASASLGEMEADIEDPFQDEGASASTGGPAERHAAETTVSAPPVEDP